MTDKPHIVLVGSGPLASEALRVLDATGHEVTVVLCDRDVTPPNEPIADCIAPIALPRDLLGRQKRKKRGRAKR